MTRPTSVQIRVSPEVAELVRQAARNWAASEQRDVSDKDCAGALILTGLAHAAEAKKRLA